MNSWIHNRSAPLLALAIAVPGWNGSCAEPAPPPSTGVVVQARVAQAPAGKQWEHYRVSAIIDMGDELRVGVVNTTDGNQKIITVGDSLSDGVICMAADVERRTAVFDWDGTTVELSLTGAINLPASPASEKTISAKPEDFMATCLEKARKGQSMSAEDMRQYRELLAQKRTELLKRYVPSQDSQPVLSEPAAAPSNSP